MKQDSIAIKQDNVSHNTNSALAQIMVLSHRIEVLERELEEAKQSIQISGIQRWDVHSASSPRIENEPTYDLSLRNDGSFVAVDFYPTGLKDNVDALNGLPQLSVCFEVVDGLPRAYIYGNIHGQLDTIVMAAPDGKVIFRKDSDPDVHIDGLETTQKVADFLERRIQENLQEASTETITDN